MQYSQLLTFGSIAKDELMTHPGLLQSQIDIKNLDHLNIFFMVDSLKQALGGIATNIAYNYKLLNKGKCYILGGLGIDSQDFTEFYNANAIDTTYLKFSKDLYTGTFKGISFLDQNQIGAFYYGANLEGKKIYLKDIANIENSLLVLSSSHPEAVGSIQKQALDLNIDYLYDPGMMLTWIDNQLLKEGLLGAKYIVANDYEMNLIFERTGLKIQDLIALDITVITTKGKDGLHYQYGSENIKIEAFPVTNFKDPTGAGDAFRGGFLAYLLDDKPILDSLIAGSALASMAVESLGGVNHVLNNQEFLNRFEHLKKAHESQK
ncbi:MAG: PfkB family carbohydrate kinase [bacterium]